jgi:hypothetical protein
LRSIERDPQKWKPVLPGQTPSFVPRSRSNLLKERMIFSPNRSHFGGSCATEPRAFSHTKCLPDSWSKMHAIARPVHR